MPKIQAGDDGYRIIGDSGEEGEAVAYGEVADLTVGLNTYVALVNLNGEDMESELPEEAWLIKGTLLRDVEVEEVEFTPPGTEDGEGDGGGDDTASGNDEEDDDEDDEDEEVEIEEDDDEDLDDEEEVEELETASR